MVCGRISEFIENLQERGEKMNKKELVKRLAIFATLMQGQKGIVTKSPKYICQKFEIIMEVEYPENALDWINRQVYEKWLATWEEHLKELDID